MTSYLASRSVRLQFRSVKSQQINGRRSYLKRSQCRLGFLVRTCTRQVNAGSSGLGERIKQLLRMWGAAHHPCHPGHWDDRGTCKIWCSSETLSVFLCLVVVRSSPCTGVTAAGGSAFGSHILVVQRQNVDCAFPYYRS